MKRLYIIYAAVLAGLTLAGVLWVALALHDNNAPALRKLGKGEREFREARNELVLNTADAVPMLVKYAVQRKNPPRGRVQALTILKEIALHQSLADQGHAIVPLLGEGNKNLTLATLQALAGFATTDGAREVAPFLANPDTALANAAMRALTGSAKALGSRVSAAVRAGDRALLDSCLGAAKNLPLPKDELYHMAGGYFGRTGDTAASSRAAVARGTLRQWLLCGGFHLSRWEDVERVFAPETTAIDRAAIHTAGGAPNLVWRPQFVESPWRSNLWDGIEKKAPAVVYLICPVTVPDDRDVMLFVYSFDAIMAWVNDTQVIRTVNPGLHPDIGEWGRARLHKGVNRIMLKLGRMEVGSGWGLGVRLTDAMGEGMGDAVIGGW